MNQKLPEDIKTLIRKELKISDHLMQEVEDECYIALNGSTHYVVFSKEMPEDSIMYSIPLKVNDKHPIIWDIFSDQVECLKKQKITKKTILTKDGDKPVVCSNFQTSTTQIDYLNTFYNQVVENSIKKSMS